MIRGDGFARNVAGAVYASRNRIARPITEIESGSDSRQESFPALGESNQTGCFRFLRF
jgi:hypothetical protein